MALGVARRLHSVRRSYMSARSVAQLRDMFLTYTYRRAGPQGSVFLRRLRILQPAFRWCWLPYSQRFLSYDRREIYSLPVAGYGWRLAFASSCLLFFFAGEHSTVIFLCSERLVYAIGLFMGVVKHGRQTCVDDRNWRRRTDGKCSATRGARGHTEGRRSRKLM